MSTVLRCIRWTDRMNSPQTEWAGRDGRLWPNIIFGTPRSISGILMWAVVLLTLAPTAVGQETESTSQDEVREPVTFAAGDSLVLYIRGETKSGSLYGNSSLKMADAALKAFQIDILFAEDEVRAMGLESDSGWVGIPEFTRGTDIFEGESLA